MGSLYGSLGVLCEGWLMFMLACAATVRGRGIARYFSPWMQVVKRFPQVKH
jgi:hypothetical protein